MSDKCSTCNGEGGFVTILEDGEQEFITCGDCNGYGFREGSGESMEAREPEGAPLAEPEPYDIRQARSDRQTEEELRRKEQNV